MKSRKDEKLPNFFQADIVRREIGESLSITLHNYEFDDYKDDNEFINANTTKAILKNNNLAHTRELGNKKPKHNYITALLMVGIRIVKSKIQRS